MVEHDLHVGQLLKLIDDLGIANDTVVQYSTDNGPHFNTWPDAANTPFRSEKNSNWEGAYRVPAFVRWPGHFPAGVTLNGIVAHEDWLPTFAAIAGEPGIKDKSQGRVDLNGGGTYNSYIDGYDQLAYLAGTAKESPRRSSSTSTTRATSWPCAGGTGRSSTWRTAARASACGASRSSSCACRSSSTCAATLTSARSTARTPTTTGSSAGRSSSPVNRVPTKFLMTLKDYPPSQVAGSWSLSALQKKIEDSAGGH